MPAFKGFLQASDEESSEKQSALEAELGKLSDYLAANGPYLKVCDNLQSLHRKDAA